MTGNGEEGKREWEGRIGKGKMEKGRGKEKGKGTGKQKGKGQHEGQRRREKGEKGEQRNGK